MSTEAVHTRGTELKLRRAVASLKREPSPSKGSTFNVTRHHRTYPHTTGFVKVGRKLHQSSKWGSAYQSAFSQENGHHYFCCLPCQRSWFTGTQWKVTTTSCPIHLWVHQQPPKDSNGLPFFSSFQIAFGWLLLVKRRPEMSKECGKYRFQVSSHWDTS